MVEGERNATTEDTEVVVVGLYRVKLEHPSRTLRGPTNQLGSSVRMRNREQRVWKVTLLVPAGVGTRLAHKAIKIEMVFQSELRFLPPLSILCHRHPFFVLHRLCHHPRPRLAIDKVPNHPSTPPSSRFVFSQSSSTTLRLINLLRSCCSSSHTLLRFRGTAGENIAVWRDMNRRAIDQMEDLHQDVPVRGLIALRCPAITILSRLASRRNLRKNVCFNPWRVTAFLQLKPGHLFNPE